MFISELLVHSFRGIYFSDGDVGVLLRKFMKYRLQALAVAAPRRVEVEDDEFVRGFFEERAEGRGVDLDDFRRYAGGQSYGEERPHHLLAVFAAAASRRETAGCCAKPWLCVNCHKFAARLLHGQDCTSQVRERLVKQRGCDTWAVSIFFGAS